MSNQEFRFIVEVGASRLDRLVADHTGTGRRAVRQWFESGLVRVNGWVATAADPGVVGAEVVVEASEPAMPLDRLPTIQVVLERPDMVVISKPSGLHSERGKGAGSAAQRLEEIYGDLSLIGERPAESGLVHRLDRDTSGVLVAARTHEHYLRLRACFRRGEATKGYLALVLGRVASGLDIDSPLRRSANRMVVADFGRDDDALAARTYFEPLETGEDWSLVSVTMRTGVMHQIRAHAALAGHPLLGDSLYGGPELPGCSRRGQLLHAFRVRIGKEVDVCVGPPADFLEAYARLQRERG